MRFRDLSTINYRSSIIDTDIHGSKLNTFSKTLSNLIGSVRPETLYSDVKDVGSIITGNILIYVPRDKNINFNVKIGDGFYLDGDDTNNNPTWIVSNRPFPYIKHYLLILKNKVQ